MSYNIEYKLLYSILESASEGFLITDNDYNIKHIFPVAQTILDIDNLNETTNLKDFLVDKSILSDIVEHQNTEIKTAKGNIITVLISIISYDEHNNIIKIFPTKLDDSILFDSAFLSNMFHDLKTPLQSITGFSQALLHGIAGEISEKQLKYIAIIGKNATNLLRMVNNIVDFSRLDSGQTTFNPVIIDIKKFLESIMESLESSLASKSINLVTDASKISSNKILTDQNQLYQVIKKLLDIAIAFTEKDFIKLEMLHPDIKLLERYYANKTVICRQESYLLVSISNIGKQIPQDEIINIFEDSKQLLDKNTQKYNDMALGVAISSKIVTKLGGYIWLESQKIEGLTFNFVIPLQQPTES